MRPAVATTHVSVAEIRRATFEAACRLAVAVSAVAVVATLLLSVIGDVSTARMVVFVALVGFVASWVHTGRVQRELLARRARRVTVVASH